MSHQAKTGVDLPSAAAIALRVRRSPEHTSGTRTNRPDAASSARTTSSSMSSTATLKPEAESSAKCCSSARRRGRIQSTLTDENMETAEVLVILLDIWHGKPCPAPLDTDTMWLLLKVINLAKKYDCPAATYTMSKAYNACLNEGVSPRTCFILLAMLDDLPGCAVAIRRAGRWRWADHSETSLRSSIVGASVFDVTFWDIETYTTVPQAYSLALLGAAKKVAMPLGDKTDWKVVADEFTRLMKDGVTPT